MIDIIQKAIDNWEDETEREATGTIEGHEIRLVKKEYEVQQRGPHAWKVAVYVDKEDIPSEQIKQLEADEAQEKFEELAKKHGLTQRVK